MKLVFTSYSATPEYDQPAIWLDRINAYTGILEDLARDHEVTGIERINYEGEYDRNGVHYIFTRQRKKVVYIPRRIHRLVKNIRPDVVFVNGFIFPLQIIQLGSKLGKGRKIIVYHHAEKPFTGYKRWFQKWADRYVSAYLFASSAFMDEWKRNINTRKIYEVMHVSSVFKSMDRKEARRLTKVEGQPVFLWVGRLNENKDPLTVVRSFIEFLSWQPAARLYMIFQTEELLPQVNDVIKKNRGTAKSIHLVGNVPHGQLGSWHNSADFFISASHYEGGGAAVVEAMSCGCIPILTNIDAFAGLTGGGKCGFLFKPGDEKGLLTALLKTREINLETEREKVQEQYRNELSFEAIGKKIRAILATL